MLSLGCPSAKSPMKGPVSPSTRCAPNFVTNNRTLRSQKTFTNPNYVNEFPSNMRPVDNSLLNYPNSGHKPIMACENSPRLPEPPSGSPLDKEGELGRGNEAIHTLLGSTKVGPFHGQQLKEHPEVNKVTEKHQSSDALDHNSPSSRQPEVMDTSNSIEDSQLNSNSIEDSQLDNNSSEKVFIWRSRIKIRRSSLTASEDSFVASDNEGIEEFTSEDESSDEEPASSRRRLSVSESEDSFIMFEKADVESMDDLSEEEDDYENEDDNEDEEAADQSGSSDEVVYRTVTPRKVTFAPDENLCTVHRMIKWSFAYEAARKGHWETYARDRCRFKDRILRVERNIKLVLDPKHRAKIYSERFLAV
ncbi:protein phosphatase 1 regulatory subunit 15A isoform X2 [Dendroctonus ponderosae]|uniref:protein phosphatase 1 regulatory subunit 15A isoform X2 n=1 Tax=Dendroctonus ponderosae TaxID=77166 RepID=UPI002034F459|nr:protein phosphatase 1 regulatory subunit 15A isoform X2 [Dendroctonus ponderosae]